MKKLKLKKNVYLGAIIAGICAVLVLILFVAFSNSTDGAKFKKEYEKLNGQRTDSKEKYQSLKIKKKNKIKYGDMKDAIEMIEKGSGIIYFGMPECPWCRSIVPILVDKTNCSCLEEVLYVNMKEERNTYEIENELPVETKKASEDYYRLLELLDEHLDTYTIVDGEGVEHVLDEKRIYLPLVVAVNDGRVVGAHTGAVDLKDGQSPYDELDDTQKSEIEVIFTNLIEEATKEKTTCEGHC